MNRLSAARLRYLRNKIPIADVIQRRLGLSTHYRSQLLRFSCPLCRGFDTAINPATNLARCFHCQKNFNAIDLVMLVVNCSFLDAVKFLENPAIPDQRI
jgi:DNA primase